MLLSCDQFPTCCWLVENSHMLCLQVVSHMLLTCDHFPRHWLLAHFFCLQMLSSYLCICYLFFSCLDKKLTCSFILQVGDLVKVLQRNTSGQWEGEVFGKDKKGFFPFRCVRVLEGIEREEALKTLQASNGPGQTKGSGDGPHRPSNGLVD